MCIPSTRPRAGFFIYSLYSTGSFIGCDMAKNVLQSTILTANGAISVTPNAKIEVRNSSGLLAPLWLDREGKQPSSNPFTADSNGFFRVYVGGGRYHITASADGRSQEWHDVPLGTSQGYDLEQLTVLVNDGMFEDTVAGIAGTADRAFFYTPGDNDIEFARLYQNVGGQAVYIDSYPSAEALQDAITGLSDAVADAEEAALLAEGYAQDASVSAVAAAQSEAGSGASLSQAQDARDAAVAARDVAQSAETIAVSARDEATSARLAAEAAETQASGHASDASAAQTQADQAAQTAAGHSQDAAASAAAAEQSKSGAEDLLAAFRGAYYGGYENDPATDPNGNLPDAGDAYWNTLTNKLRIFDGEGWISIPDGYLTEADLGTEPDQIPTNRRLGSAAVRDVGTDPDNMPDIEIADARYVRPTAFGGPSPSQVGRGAIVESGETPEGSYVRWEDGVQVCWATSNNDGSVALDVTTLDDQLFAFPRDFVGPENSLLTTYNPQNLTAIDSVRRALASGGVRGQTSLQNWRVRLGLPDSSASLNYGISLGATGRWK